MNLDCTTPKYGELYARWLTNPGKLLDLAGMKRDDRVLDLCGGTGIVSREALERGALEVALVDLAPRTGQLIKLWPLFHQRAGRAEDIGSVFKPDCFDLVVCRQAIGYLDMERTAHAVHYVLKPGGRFVFNTFVKPRWAFKSYVLGNTRYLEASGYVGRAVVHVQAGLGLGVDVTKFRWHRDEDLDAVLALYFTVKKVTEGRSVYYVCTKGELHEAR